MKCLLSAKILIIWTLLFISCTKDKLNDGDSIVQYSNTLEDTDKDLFKLRAAFAKCVAKAFGDVSFREYFKKEFCTPSENHFKELLVSQHLNDKVNQDGTTLKILLENSADDEVKAIFGDNLINTVVEKDPCVVIKLPDLFRNFNWNTQETIPMVIALTPKPETTFGQSLRYLSFFHDGGYKVLYNPFDYFHCTVKYSEDYFLLDIHTFENEKGISFYEILPQAMDETDGMKGDIKAIGEEAKGSSGKAFVNKFEAFKLWQNKYSYKGPLLANSTTCTHIDCIRTCIELDQSNLILDTFQVNLSRIFEYQNNKFLDESATFSFVFWSSLDDQFMKRINIPSLPYEFFEARDITVKLKKASDCNPPEIDFNSVELGKGKPFSISALIKKYVLPEEIIYARSDFQIYSDEVRDWQLNHPSFSIAPAIKSTYSYLEQIDFVTGCNPPVKIPTSQSWFSVNY